MTHRIEEVVRRGMCIGCGACSAATGGAIPIKLGTHRLYQADLRGVQEADRRLGSMVCPFSDESPNEDELGAPSLQEGATADPHLGCYTATLAGRVRDDEYLKGSSSGGLTSYVLGKLIEGGHIDGFLNVGIPGPSPEELFGYQISGLRGARSRRKSQYYANTMADVLRVVEGSDLRFALVGVPCFIRAARALVRARPEYAERLRFFVGLVCGHYKTQNFAVSLAWQVGVPPGELAEVDFRVKNPDRPASEYDFGARAKGSREWRTASTKSLVGGSWGHSAFQPEACNFCDDVVGETADVSFGDAWLPRFVEDPRGTNIVVSRNRLVESILVDGERKGEIDLFRLTPEEAVASQAGGFRHRREGLALRLADDVAMGLSVPRKRVEPDGRRVSRRRAQLLRQRRHMARLSHQLFAEALKSGDLEHFITGMRLEIARYRQLDNTLGRRLARRVRSAGRSIRSGLGRR